MILEAIETEKAVQDVSGRWSVEKNGVRAILGKDSKGRYLLTGFNDHRKEKTATDSIRAGIAAHRYTHGFPEIYAQVGAVAASLESSEKSTEKSSNERDSVNKSWCWFDKSGRFWIKKSALEAFIRGVNRKCRRFGRVKHDDCISEILVDEQEHEKADEGIAVPVF